MNSRPQLRSWIQASESTCDKGVFSFHSSLTTSTTNWVQIFSGLLFYALSCNTPSEKTGLWEIPIKVSSAFNSFIYFVLFEQIYCTIIEMYFFLFNKWTIINLINNLDFVCLYILIRWWKAWSVYKCPTLVYAVSEIREWIKQNLQELIIWVGIKKQRLQNWYTCTSTERCRVKNKNYSLSPIGNCFVWKHYCSYSLNIWRLTLLTSHFQARG